MNTRYARLQVVLLVLAVAVVAGNAQALTLHDLKGQNLQILYGTYAPHGDCNSEPRIMVDESGFAYRFRGKTSHPATFEWAVSYGGPEYQGKANWFFPFPVTDSDFGRVLMTFSPDERPGTLGIEANVGPGESMDALQSALVRGSPYARCTSKQH